MQRPSKVILGFLFAILTAFNVSSAFAVDSNQHFRLQGLSSLRRLGVTAAITPQHATTSSFVQPYICIDSATTGGGTTAAFTNVGGGRFPLLANLTGPLDQVGLVVNLPSNTPVGSVSFQVVPTNTSQNLYIAIGGNYVTPSGVTGTFRSDNQPNSILGNQVKGKNVQYNFNLFNLINGVGNVPIPAGSKLTFLLINVEELFPSLLPGSVYLDNVIVNNQAITNKVVSPASSCPIPF